MNKEQEIKRLLEVREFYRDMLDKANSKMRRIDQEIDFICDILQDIGINLEKLGIDPLAD